MSLSLLLKDYNKYTRHKPLFYELIQSVIANVFYTRNSNHTGKKPQKTFSISGAFTRLQIVT